MIQQVKIKLYSDPQLTQVEKEYIAAGTTTPQTIEMDELDPATYYYAVAYATDGDGVTGESQPRQFRTLEAAVTVGGEIAYTNVYDVLKFRASFANASQYTLVAQGIEISRFMDLHVKETFFYDGDGTTYTNISPFEAHTLYYYRYFADFDEVGRVYGQPHDNTITTMYAKPVFTILPHDITTNGAEVTISYSGDYPIDYNTLRCTITNGIGEVYNVQLDNLTANSPETVTLTGLTSGMLYEVEAWMAYYNDYAEAYNAFTTAEAVIHNFNFGVNYAYVLDYSQMLYAVTATQTGQGRQLTVTNIGVDICAVADFTGHQLGGDKGSGALSFNFTATGLNEYRRYYYRPWIETEEYGREYGRSRCYDYGGWPHLEQHYN